MDFKIKEISLLLKEYVIGVLIVRFLKLRFNFEFNEFF